MKCDDLVRLLNNLHLLGVSTENLTLAVAFATFCSIAAGLISSGSGLTSSSSDDEMELWLNPLVFSCSSTNSYSHESVPPHAISFCSG